jgi:hypothetical protein
MDVDRNAQRFGLLEEGQVFRIVRIPALLDRRTLESEQYRVVDVVLQLVHAAVVVGIDRTPAGKAVRVFLDEVRDQFPASVRSTYRRPIFAPTVPLA